jgi:hypothetical protein
MASMAWRASWASCCAVSRSSKYVTPAEEADRLDHGPLHRIQHGGHHLAHRLHHLKRASATIKNSAKAL